MVGELLDICFLDGDLELFHSMYRIKMHGLLLSLRVGRVGINNISATPVLELRLL